MQLNEFRNFRYPSTRYSGSKLRFLDWIWSHVKDLKYKTVLDVFGGTGSVSLMFKRRGKQVFYNDILYFNQIIGRAVIENSKHIVDDTLIDNILYTNGDHYPSKVQRDFQGVFFLDEENEWLDKIIPNINQVKNKYQRSILFSSLFQACLSKRPYNLFHRANLYMRTANVARSFGNKNTWEIPFPTLFRRFVNEYNGAVFSNGLNNKVIGGFDAISVPNGVDLVYLDPPYFSKDSTEGTNYLAYYHFLERISLYNKWDSLAHNLYGKSKRLVNTPEVDNFAKKNKIKDSLEKVIENFSDNRIVMSYQTEGIPSPEDIIKMFKRVNKKVKIHEIEHKYVLSRKTKKELLFIAL